MRPTTLRTVTALTLALGAAAATGMAGSAAQPRFLPDDPVRVERNTEDASGIKAVDVNLFADFIYNVVTGKPPATPTRAGNVNTIDEVPDSSWFTNRAGSLPLTPELVANGPNRGTGPLAGTWTVSSSKSDGVTPGFTVKDTSGQRWFLKFDPPGHRGMTTGTEVVVTKLMWALGYNVPENHIAYLRREQLAVGTGAKFTPPGGSTRPMRLSDIDDLLRAPSASPTAATAWWRAGRSTGSRSVVSASKAPARMTPTTSSRTSTGVSCVGMAHSPRGSTTSTPRPSTRSTRSSAKTGARSCDTT
jgi:hypothetical protein